MCKLPVTFGGGIMIVYGGLPLSGSALNPPERSHRSYRRASTAEGWYVLSSIAEPSSSEQFGRGLSARAERGRPYAKIRRGVSNAISAALPRRQRGRSPHGPAARRCRGDGHRARIAVTAEAFRARYPRASASRRRADALATRVEPRFERCIGVRRGRLDSPGGSRRGSCWLIRRGR